MTWLRHQPPSRATSPTTAYDTQTATRSKSRSTAKSHFALLIALYGVGAYEPRTRRAYVATVLERAATAERERDQQAQIAVGAERARIAREIHDVVAHSLSEATVKTHVGQILAKLGLRDRVQAVVFAYENGVATPSP